MYPVALSAMNSTPRSSRRRRSRGVGHEDVAIGLSSSENQPLGDETSGTGSPATTLQVSITGLELNYHFMVGDS